MPRPRSVGTFAKLRCSAQTRDPPPPSSPSLHYEPAVLPIKPSSTALSGSLEPAPPSHRLPVTKLQTKRAGPFWLFQWKLVCHSDQTGSHGTVFISMNCVAFFPVLIVCKLRKVQSHCAAESHITCVFSLCDALLVKWQPLNKSLDSNSSCFPHFLFHLTSTLVGRRRVAVLVEALSSRGPHVGDLSPER